jgi:hypothetical protein
LKDFESKKLENSWKEIAPWMLIFLLFSGLIVSITILCMAPPVSKDALTHHLAVPKLYLQHGGVYEIPELEFSYYPMNLDLLYLIPLYFGNDIIPKFIHFSFALLTAWLIYSYLESRINSRYGILGAMFFLSVPIIVRLSITAYVDLGLIFFSTAALLLVLKWVDTGFQSKFLFLSAGACGLAMGTKYNGLITLLILTLFVPFVYARYAPVKRHVFFRSAAYGSVFLLISILVFSPWMARNYFWTHNPVYPLYDHWFNPQNPGHQGALSLFTLRSALYHESWWEMLLLPVRIFFQGQDESARNFDGRLNPFLLIIPVVGFLFGRKDSPLVRGEKKIFFAFTALFFAFAFFSTVLRIRYISPIIPPLVILSAFGVRALLDMTANLTGQSRRTAVRAVIFSMILASFFLNGMYVFNQFEYFRPLDYLAGKLTREEYITVFRSEYPTMKYINQNLPVDAKVLFFDVGNRGYYCNRSYLFDLYKGASRLRQFVERSNSPESILTEFENLRVTHFLIRQDLFEKWVNDNFDARERSTLADFFRKYVKILYFNRGYGLLQVGPARHSVDRKN